MLAKKRAKLKEPKFWTILKTPYRHRDPMEEMIDRMAKEIAYDADKEILKELLKLGKK